MHIHVTNPLLPHVGFPFGSVGIASQHFPIFTSTKRLCFHDSREYCLPDFHKTRWKVARGPRW